VTVMEKYQWEATQSTIVAAIIMALIVVTRLAGTPRSEIPAAKNAPELARLTPPSHAQSPPIETTVPVSNAHAARVPANAGQVSAKHKTAGSPHSDPREFSVGPNEIANRYTLLGAERKQVSPEDDELIVRLHVESLAIDPLVSPFESDMLEISSPGLQPIKPSTPFRLPIPSGSSRNQDIAFRVPAGFRLQEATLRIHYYNYQHEVPLSLTQ
jgi:hypothetical protein